MSKFKVVYFFALFIAIGIASLVTSNQTQAIRGITFSYSFSQDGGYNALCSGSAWRVDFHPYIRGASLNTTTGKVTYQLRVQFARCDGSATRAYAVTGTPNNCPLTGNYATPGDGTNAYDCVKFIGSPPYKDPGTSLKCGSNYNSACLKKPVDDTVIREKTQPINISDGMGIVDVTPAVALQIPDWANRRLKSGSYVLNAGAMCQYYKYGSAPTWSGEPTGNYRRCVDIRITARWVMDFDAAHVYSISDSTAIPGQAITWNWGVRNNGPDSLGSNLNWSGSHDVGCQANWTVGRTGAARTWVYKDDGLAVGATFTSCTNTFTIPTTATNGQQFCQSLYYRPNHDTDYNQVTTGNLCTTVTGTYSLTPSITATPNDVATPGQVETLAPRITKNGTSSASNIAWQINRIVYNSGATPGPTGNYTPNAVPCTFFTATGRASCGLVTSGSGTIASIPAATSSYTSFPAAATSDTLPATLTAGSRVCYALSIQPWGNGTGGTNWRHSNLACVVVGKKPKIQVWGGDVRVHGGGITTSVTTTGGRTYGSWGEYGAASTGTNATFATGAGLLLGNTSATASNWSRLTFANTPTLGSYVQGDQSRGAAASFNAMTTTENRSNGSGNVNYSIPAGTIGAAVRVIDFGEDNVTLSASTGIQGSYIIRTSGDVTVTGNIQLANAAPLTGLQSIPGVAIVANNINVQNAVTTIDAWLLANSEIDTCSEASSEDVGGLLTTGICQNQLIVTGVTQANNIRLNRTANGEVATMAQPAERFILPGYAYLWARGIQTGVPRATTVLIEELPPRF